MTNMWDTVEANAWSRDFNYSDYVELYERVFPTETPFKEETYKKFCRIFEGVIDNDMNVN